MMRSMVWTIGLCFGLLVHADAQIEQAVPYLMNNDQYELLTKHAYQVQEDEAEEFSKLLEERKKELLGLRDGFLRKNMQQLWISTMATLAAVSLVDHKYKFDESSLCLYGLQIFAAVGFMQCMLVVRATLDHFYYFYIRGDAKLERITVLENILNKRHIKDA